MQENQENGEINSDAGYGVVGRREEELGQCQRKVAQEEGLMTWMGLACRTAGREGTPAALPQVAYCPSH